MKQTNPLCLSVQECWEANLPLFDTIMLQGWVKTLRVSKAGVAFLSLTDGSSLLPLQVVLEQSLEQYDELIKLTTGASVSLIGTLIATPDRLQDREYLAQKVLKMHAVDDPGTYPLAPKAHSLEFLREVAHLRPRALLFQAIAKLRSHLFHAIHQFFAQENFHWLAAPIITSADCEGAGELFQIAPSQIFNPEKRDQSAVNDFFGKAAYLTVSGQLNAEAYASALGKVYTFGPTFRAENSNTSRHLSEFWMLEPEVAFIDLDGLIDLACRLIKFLAKSTLEKQSQAVEVLANFYKKPLISLLEALHEKEYVRLTYTEAITILKRHEEKFVQPVHWGMDLGTEHERFLAERHVQGPIFLTDYPRAIKAFYMRLNDDTKTVAATDLLVPGIGEILGGSQREERLDVLNEQMKFHQIDPQPLEWYRDLRRYGSVTHAGFGIGFERLLCYFGGIDNVRDAIPFPRAPKMLNF